MQYNVIQYNTQQYKLKYNVVVFSGPAHPNLTASDTQELSNGARGLRVDWLCIKARYIVSLRITLYLNSLYHNRIDIFCTLYRKCIFIVSKFF